MRACSTLRSAVGGWKRCTSSVTSVGRQLAQRGDVVEHVERPAVRGDHQVVAFDHDIGHLRVRQIQRAAIASARRRRTKHKCRARFRRRAAPARSGSSRTACTKSFAGNAVDDFGPGLAVIVGLEDVGLAVVDLIVLRGHVRRAGIVRRGFDQADAAEIAACPAA